MDPSITKADEYLADDKQPHRAIRFGEMYQPSKECRKTIVRVDGVDIHISENLWKDTDNEFDTEYKWSVTTNLQVPKECETKDEVSRFTSDNIRIIKAVGFLGYELHKMEEDGAAVWDRPAPDR